MSVNLPPGGRMLLCPTGPRYSMMSDVDFQAIQDDDYIYCKDIFRGTWGNWYANGKVIKLTHLVTNSVYGITTNDVYDVTQWLLDSGDAVYENLGSHPYPRTTGFDAGLQNVLYFVPISEWAYRVKGDGSVPIISSPDYMLFIHKDKFYFALGHMLDPDKLNHVTFSDAKVDMEYIYTSGPEIITSNFRLEITERFYI